MVLFLGGAEEDVSEGAGGTALGDVDVDELATQGPSAQPPAPQEERKGERTSGPLRLS